MEHLPVDFIATLYYRTTGEGGRKTPAKSGYRPEVKFPFEIMTAGCSQTFLDKEWVNPGETVEAEMRMLSSTFFNDRLSEGQILEIREGRTVIATGIIKKIVNEKLRVDYGINDLKDK